MMAEAAGSESFDRASSIAQYPKTRLAVRISSKISVSIQISNLDMNAHTTMKGQDLTCWAPVEEE
jgi:hypothetical protein